MILRQLHRDELIDIAKRGTATALVVILFWFITAPALFFDKLEGDVKPEDAVLLCQYCAAMTTIVVVGCFWSSYHNLLTPNVSENERKLGFIIFWSIGSYFGEVIWLAWFSEWPDILVAKASLHFEARWMQGWSWVSLFNKDLALLLNLRGKAPEDLDLAYYYALFLGSVSMIRTLDGFRLVGQFVFLLLGTTKYKQQARNELKYREALFWYSVHGIFQCYSFVQSIFYQMDGPEKEPGNVIDQCIIWSIRLFLVFGALTSAIFAYQLLFNKCGEGQVRQQ